MGLRYRPDQHGRTFSCSPALTKPWSFPTLKDPNPTLPMAISDDEARRLIEHLERTAREAAEQQDKPGITGIINQWRVDVEAGRPVERKLKVRQSPGLDVLTGTPRSSTTRSEEPTSELQSLMRISYAV